MLLACGHWARTWIGIQPADGDTHGCMRCGEVTPAIYLADQPLTPLGLMDLLEDRRDTAMD